MNGSGTIVAQVTAILDEPPPVCSGGDTAKGGEVVRRLDALAVRQSSRPEENRQGQAAPLARWLCLVRAL